MCHSHGIRCKLNDDWRWWYWEKSASTEECIYEMRPGSIVFICFCFTTTQSSTKNGINRILKFTFFCLAFTQPLIRHHQNSGCSPSRTRRWKGKVGDAMGKWVVCNWETFLSWTEGKMCIESYFGKKKVKLNSMWKINL